MSSLTLSKLINKVKGNNIKPCKYLVKYFSSFIFLLLGPTPLLPFVNTIDCHDSKITACKNENKTTVYSKDMLNKNNASILLLCIKRKRQRKRQKKQINIVLQNF